MTHTLREQFFQIHDTENGLCDLRRAISRERWNKMPTFDKEGDQHLTPSQQPRKRVRIASTRQQIHEMIVSRRYVEAIEAAEQNGGQLHCAHTETLCLRRILASHEVYWTAFRATVAPTLENLYNFIETGKDDEVVDLLRRGARLDHSRRAYGVLLELCERNDMPRTITYLLTNDLLPGDLDLKYFVASLGTYQAELSHDLAELPVIVEQLNALPIDERLKYYETYCYNMFKYLARNALDYMAFDRLSTTIYLNGLTDAEFLTLMRHGSLFVWASDEKVLALRRRDNSNPYRAVAHLSPLAHWLRDPMVWRQQMHQFREQLEAHLNSLPRTQWGVSTLIAVFRLRSLCGSTDAVRAA